MERGTQCSGCGAAISAKGQRYCRACKSEAQRKYRARIRRLVERGREMAGETAAKATARD